MNDERKERVLQVVSDVFGVPVENLDEEASPDTIDEWNSLKHINLILALEAEFATSISPEEAMEMLSIGLVCMILEEKATSAAT